MVGKSFSSGPRDTISVLSGSESSDSSARHRYCLNSTKITAIRTEGWLHRKAEVKRLVTEILGWRKRPSLNGGKGNKKEDKGPS